MGKRTSQLTQLTAAQVAQGDFLPIVDVSAGQTKYVTVKDLTGLPDTGWLATGESWAYSSFSSTTRIGVITVPSDATTKYSVGMWVRITQATGGTKYGKITAVTSTSLSVNFFATYTLNNEAITSPLYSPLAQPYGAPALPLKSTDANGWTVFDFGITKQYHKNLSIGPASVSQNSRTAWATNVPDAATAAAFMVVSEYSGNYSGHINSSQEAAGTSSINGSITSIYSGGALSATGVIIMSGRDV